MQIACNHISTPLGCGYPCIHLAAPLGCGETISLPPASDWKITLLPDNTIEKTQGESAVLELVSTKIIADKLIIVFRGSSAGSAAVVIGVVGEIGESSNDGHFIFTQHLKILG